MARRIGQLGSLGAATAVALGLAGAASAHPHIWVKVETTVLFEAGSIAGFRHKWTFDEFYTAMAIQGLDTDNDGRYSREELAELAKVNIDGLKDFQFFTFARLGSQALALDEVKDYWLEHAEAPPDPEAAKLPKVEVLPRLSEAPAKPGFFARLWGLIFGAPEPEGQKEAAAGATKVLSLHFTVPLKQPVLPEAPDFNFAIYDPSFFIAFELAKESPVRLGADAPADCRLDIGRAERDADEAQRLGEAFASQLGSQNFGLQASRPIKLACGPRS